MSYLNSAVWVKSENWQQFIHRRRNEFPLKEIIPWATLRVSNGFILLIDRYEATINFVSGDIGHPGGVMGGR